MIPARALPSDQDNCLRDCIASVLELDTLDVPHFVAEQECGDGAWSSPGRWLHSLKTWLKPRGLYPLCLTPARGLEPDCYWIAIGDPAGMKRPKIAHAVVMFGREMVHDPYPKRLGIKRANWALILVPIDAARVTLKG